MEPTIYKPGSYKTPGIYKGSCGIYKGRGVYNDGAGVGNIGDIFSYHTNFSDLDLDTLLDNGVQYSFDYGTISGLEKTKNGLLLKNRTAIVADLESIDFAQCKKVIAECEYINRSNNRGTTWFWILRGLCGNGNFYLPQRGQGFAAVGNSLNTTYSVSFYETILGLPFTNLVEYPGVIYFDELLKMRIEWNETEIKYFQNDILVCTSMQNISNAVSLLKKLLWFGTYDRNIEICKVELDAFS